MDFSKFTSVFLSIFFALFVNTSFGDWGLEIIDPDPPTHLYVVKSGDLTEDELVTVASLQGIVNKEEAQLFIKTGASSTWLWDLRDTYGVQLTWVHNVKGNKTELHWLMDHFSSYLEQYWDGDYNLYDYDSNPMSKNIAVSWAGGCHCVAVDVDLESEVQSWGYTKQGDVTTWTDVQYYNSQWNNTANNAILVSDPASRCMEDWLAANRLQPIWNSNKSWTSSVYNSVDDTSPVFGWGDPSAHADPYREGYFIEYHSEKSLYQVPAALRLNFTVYASMDGRTPHSFQQNSPKTFTKRTGVHHVTFIWNSMDNLNFTTSGPGWAESPDYYGSSHRGDFPVGWGMPGSMIEMAPNIVKWYYDNAYYNKDYFVGTFSGNGYVFPSEFPDINQFGAESQYYMNRLDTDCMMIHDIADIHSYGPAWYFARMANQRGFFYTDYGDYNKWNGDIVWYYGDPFITCRFELVRGTMGPEQLKNALNAQSTNSSSEDGYSYVCVRVGGGNQVQTMDDIKWIVDRLDPDVRVVTPLEFVEQVRMNGAD